MTKGLSGRGFDLDLSREHFMEAGLGALLTGKLELKHDYQAWRTGNVFVEFKQHSERDGVPVWIGSGIAITESPWWAFIAEYL